MKTRLENKTWQYTITKCLYKIDSKEDKGTLFFLSHFFSNIFSLIYNWHWLVKGSSTVWNPLFYNLFFKSIKKQQKLDWICSICRWKSLLKQNLDLHQLKCLPPNNPKTSTCGTAHKNNIYTTMMISHCHLAH